MRNTLKSSVDAWRMLIQLFVSASLLSLAPLAAAGSPTETVVYSFTFTGPGSVGLNGPNGLIAATDGNFYGPAGAGGEGENGAQGGIFKVTPAGTGGILYECGTAPNDCNGPESLIQGSDGNFYGVSLGGGVSQNGVLFKLTAAGSYTSLYQFQFNNGASSPANPDGDTPNYLIQGSDGNLYGTTRQGGTSNSGAVFKSTLSGQEQVLYSFAASANQVLSDSALEPTGIIQGNDGNLYVTTSYGGNGAGSVIKLTTSGEATDLYDFTGCYTVSNATTCAGSGSNPTGDGAFPNGLVQASDGNFYGTTVEGGAHNEGTIFRLTPGGSETVL